jgi:hypothetical protein
MQAFSRLLVLVFTFGLTLGLAKSSSEPEVLQNSVSIHRVRRGSMPLRRMAAGSISSLNPAKASVTLLTLSDDGVKVGQAASIQLRPSQVIFGRVARVDESAAGEGITAELEFPEALPSDVLGERIGALIDVGEVPNVMYFERPRDAKPNSDAPIFLLEADGQHARRVNVHYGRLVGSLVEIVSGLAEGDMVISGDMSKFACYERVRLIR